MLNNTVDISIIIPTINRYENLLNTLSYIESQKEISYEIIVIDQTKECPSDIITKIKSKKNVIYTNSDIPSASLARNIGINMSKSEVLLFIDDDVIINDTLFAYKHYRHYVDSNTVGVVGRSYESLNKTVTYTRSSRSFNKNIGFFYFPKNYGCCTYVSKGRSNNLSVRKKFALDVGGMDENYERGAHREEGDFCLRVSRKHGMFIYDPQAELEHIGNKIGGIRSWNDSDYIKAKHNMVGAIYFNFKMAPLRYRVEYLYATLRYLILNKTILSRPHLYFSVLKRYLSASILAYRKYKKGPIYINSETTQ